MARNNCPAFSELNNQNDLRSTIGGGTNDMQMTNYARNAGVEFCITIVSCIYMQGWQSGVL
ncbi:MAG: hypothetical protein PHY24_07675 [Candidatus Cloacimonetes bacterium]|nr:hypothetical protein [Candidatus Cloacimonadota bacterium]MDD3534173.1 hypothetical protein [Candidatus Cloacimonadota bacterium]